MPAENERIIAWLLSDAYLNEEEMNKTQKRLLLGEVLEPTEGARRIAQRALGLYVETDRYTYLELFGLGILCCLFTPVFGFALWAFKRMERPLKAKQLLWVSSLCLPVDVLLILYNWSF